MAQLREASEREWEDLKLLGQSDAMLALRTLICRYAASNAPILILGETGTGKENVANACHKLSDRARGPFQVAQCSALTEALIESELFGHVKGAFTGATQDRIGRLEAASGGTIFLDEVGTTAASMQVKLLRVLQEKCIERVGDNEPVSIDIRVIAATNEDLGKALESRRMRRDFYVRLATLIIKVPPLRDRQNDVILLSQVFLNQEIGNNGKGTKTLSEGARQRLLSHRWPGNVRELQGVMARAACLVDHDATCVGEDLIRFDELLLSGNAPPVESASAAGNGGDVRELTARKTIDLLLGHQKPLEGVLRGADDISDLLSDVIEGVAEGTARYLDTEPGARLRRNGKMGAILDQLGLSARSGNRSLIALRCEGAVKKRVRGMTPPASPE